MATCPRCHRYLDDNHQCPRRPRLRRALLRTGGAAAGALLGMIVGAAVGAPFDIFGLLIGTLAGFTLVQPRRSTR